MPTSWEPLGLSFECPVHPTMGLRETDGFHPGFVESLASAMFHGLHLRSSATMASFQMIGIPGFLSLLDEPA